jgi:hypothetical protein
MKLTISVLGKDIEAVAEDALHALVTAEGAVTKASPTALAALATLMNGVEKCLGDVVAGAANPLQALVNAPAELSDFEAAWPELKSFLATLGIK